MKRRLVLTVTAEDIRFGEKGHHEYCPIGIAASRRFPDDWVEVGEDSMIVSFQEWEPTIRTKEFIERFDAGDDVKPGRYVFYLSDDTRGGN